MTWCIGRLGTGWKLWILGPLCFVLLSLSGPSGMAQSTADTEAEPDAGIVTYDPTFTPVTDYHQWLAARKPVQPFDCRMVARQTTKAATRDGDIFGVLVNETLYPQIQTHLEQYMQDVAADGFTVQLYTVSGGMAVELRNFLKDCHTEGMVGAVLIGDLPIPWFETDCVYPMNRENFPCDLYYMDVDGNWEDHDFDGINDYHRGDVLPEIWIGRLLAAPLTFTGEDEATLLRAYFDKNHYYRTANFRLPDRALAYIDDDWSSLNFQSHVRSAFAETKAVTDDYTTFCPDYLNEIKLTYQAVLTCAHSTPGSHLFYRPGYGDCGMTYADIIDDIPQAFFYLLYACSNARYIEYNYMAGWYIFGPSPGLIALSSTKIGGMRNYRRYYIPLGDGKTHGEAFFNWYTEEGDGGFSDYEVCVNYGMTLLGDPTLRLLPSRPHVKTVTPPTYYNAAAVDTAAISFDRPLDTARFDPSWLRAYGSFSGACPGTVAHDAANNRLVFTPDAPFMPNEIVTIQADTFVAATTGACLYSQYAWMFTIGAGGGCADDFTYIPDSLEYAGQSPSGVTAADIDRDGDIDLAVTVSGENTLALYLNDGSGTFGSPTAYAVGQQPCAAAVADLDNDGDNDVVTADGGLGTVTILRNSGDRAFSPPVTLPVDDDPIGLVAADFNADGAVDVAACNRAAGSITLLTNSGDGMTYDRTDYSVGSVPGQILTVDANRDGLLDMTTLSYNNRLTVTGKYIEDNQFYSNSCTIGRGPAAMAILDFNGDTNPDLAIVNTVQYELVILEYRKEMTYDAVATVPLPHRPHGLHTGDIDGDGDVDLVVSSETDGSLAIVFNRGDGTLSEPVVFDLGCHPRAMAMADFNGDAALDFAIVDADANQTMIFTHLAYLCGNVNGDDQTNVGDVVYMINCVFKQGPDPFPRDASDANSDGVFDIGDAVYLINFSFRGGPDPICMH